MCPALGILPPSDPRKLQCSSNKTHWTSGRKSKLKPGGIKNSIYSKTVPDNHLAQKDIQVHKIGKKPERRLKVISFYIHVHTMSNILLIQYIIFARVRTPN